ncbi:hypothetical protein LCGC14_3018330, partial [marine sediment metagenome]
LASLEDVALGKAESTSSADDAGSSGEGKKEYATREVPVEEETAEVDGGGDGADNERPF